MPTITINTDDRRLSPAQRLTLQNILTTLQPRPRPPGPHMDAVTEALGPRRQ
jgi:hypothetical protein